MMGECPTGRGVGVAHEWMDKANCLGLDTELFFPQNSHDSKVPRKVCKNCAVRVECHQYAKKLDVRFGVWGGYLRGA